MKSSERAFERTQESFFLHRKKFKISVLAIASLLALSPFPSHAKLTDFNEPHNGITFGAGTYFHPIANENAFDPVAPSAPTGTTVSNSTSGYLIPIKLGYFREVGKGSFEIYLRYLTNMSSSWSSTGGNPGTGSTTFSGYGAGTNFGVNLWKSSVVRVNLVANAEYLSQSAQTAFTPTGGTGQALWLHTNSILTGLGIQPEIWLGDFYTLSLLAAYQYGFPSSWTVTRSGALFNQQISTGALAGTSASSVTSQFGGVLVELTLKLSFY